jgi:diguanylate cyclase (GGDEF)-like protein
MTLRSSHKPVIRTLERFGSPWVLISGGLAMAVAMLSICAVVLYEGRGDALRHSTEASRNTLLVLERDIGRSIKLYDLSLQGVVDGIGQTDVMALPAHLRHDVLFDRAATANDLGSILVLDRHGNVVLDSRATAGLPAALGNFSDRSYFTVQRDNPHAGLFVSTPFASRLSSGEWSIALSRRIDNPDGSFGGVVIGAVRLQYFRNLLSDIKLGPHGVLALIHTDGQVIMRSPYNPALIGRNVRGTNVFGRMAAADSGSFSAKASIDGVNRIYEFKHLAGLPLVVEVAPAEEDIYSTWVERSVRMGILMAVFSAVFVVLLAVLAHSLSRQAKAEAMLRALARTDSLTGLHNRRTLDELLLREWRRSKRSGQALSILFVDVDRFKNYNDTYGHQAGDDVLAQIARCISGHIRRPGDIAGRYGGEEFLVVLPDTGQPGALAVAESMRMAVAQLAIAHTASEKGSVTVSIGVVTWHGHVVDTLATVIRAADQALYNAKANGRDQVFAAVQA